jgi:CRP/FNR family transcriptional regulator
MIAGFLFVSDMIGLAEDEVYSYSCEAVTKLSLCRFPRRRLQSFFERYPALERRMLEIATNELAAAQDQMVLLGRKTAQEKLASFLYLLACRSERRGDSSGAMVLPMTRSDIGDHLGLTTESVSRQFTQFRKQGIIQLETAHMVRILDHAGLIAMTGSGDGDFEPHSAVI